MIELFRELAKDYGFPFVMFCLTLFSLWKLYEAHKAERAVLYGDIKELNSKVIEITEQNKKDLLSIIEKNIKTNMLLIEKIKELK